MTPNPETREPSGGKPVIGLCGAIGSGKSTVAAALAELGCCVIDSDRLNHEVLRTAAVRDTLRDWWGGRVIAPDGAPDRAEIAKIVFADPAEKARLESLVYPLIAARRRDMIQQGKSDPAIRAFVLDSPLLFESHLDRLCDSVIFVDTRDEQRMNRLERTRGWDNNEVQRRERWQISPAEKRSRADFALDNNGTLNDLRELTRTVLERILTTYGAHP